MKFSILSLCLCPYHRRRELLPSALKPGCISNLGILGTLLILGILGTLGTLGILGILGIFNL
jgi:hypothetical protein